MFYITLFIYSADERKVQNQEGDETASNASQEFLFFTERGAEENQTKNSKVQEGKAKNVTLQKRKPSLLAKSLGEKDFASDFSGDDSLDPNIEIEKWNNGKPKVRGKRKKVSESSNKDDGIMTTTDEQPPHSPPKKSKGKKNRRESNAVRRGSRGRTKSADVDSTKLQVNSSITGKEESGKQTEDQTTQEEEVFSEIEASELVIEEEVTRDSTAAGERKSSVTKESVQLGVSGNQQESHGVIADHSAKASNVLMNESGVKSLPEKDLAAEESVLNRRNRRKNSGSLQSSFSGPESTPQPTGQHSTVRNQQTTKRKSRELSADTSHGSEINASEHDDIVIPKTNVSIHTSRYITSFLSDDHEKQALDNRGLSSRSKSLGSKTRKSKTRNDSMQRKMNSAQKSNKFQSKSFSNGTVQKDRTSVDTSKRKSMKKSRSLHSAFIGTMENLPGMEGKEELAQDLGFSDVNDINPNDLYMEKERGHTPKGKRKEEKEGKNRKTKTRGRKKKDVSVEKFVDDSIVMDKGGVEETQNELEVDGHQAVTTEDSNISVKKSRGRKKGKSLGLVNSGKRKGKSKKSSKSKSLGGMSENANEEDIEMANEDTEDEVRDSGNMDDYGSSDEQEELCAQNEGNVSQQYLFTGINNP